ncbi:MAG: peptide deformylase [Thiovulaceae bacterium]|nr:peptide deformylase [Sulfurimonadaceae bacterium]
MVKDIVTYPTPPSVNYSTDVRVVNEEIENLIQDIKDTIDANNLDGLAAFQIGSMYNIVVIKKEDASFLELINPRVIGASAEKITTIEKTAYFPGLSAKVTRDATISIIYEDRNLEQHSLKAEGDEAILLQRKIDYTFGSSFINKLSPDEKKRFSTKLEFGSDIAISESCPTTFNRDKILKVINIAMVVMVILLISSFFSESDKLWDYQLYTSFGVLGLNIIYFFYAQYEGAKYTSCTSCQIGNIIGTTIISLSKLTLIMAASYFLM